MGYNTRYSMTVVKGEEDLIEKVRKYCPEAAYSFDDKGISEEPCTWYNFSENLLEFSKLYPDSLILISGEGEDSGDLWKEYFKNGKSQKCSAKIVFDEFDENLLK